MAGSPRSLGAGPASLSFRRLLDSERLLNSLAPSLDLPLSPTADNRDLLGIRVDGVPEAAKCADQCYGISLVDTAWDSDKLDQLLGVPRGLLPADGRETGVLVRLVELEVTRGFGGRPAQYHRHVVDQRCFGQLAERVLVVGYVHHCEQDAQVVFSLQITDARVDVFRMEPVVFETVLSMNITYSLAKKNICSPQKKRTCSQPQPIVGRDIAILPWHGL